MPGSVVQTSSAQVPADVRAVLVERGRVVRVRARQVILSAGFPATDVYLVLSGRVSVFLMSAAGRETMLRSIGPDELFGELAAIDGQPRSADVVAAEDASLAVVPGAVFTSLIETSPPVALWVARHLCRQVRYLTGKVYELSTMPVAARLVAEILRIGENAGVAHGPLSILRAPTQAELAARIGTNRETVTREMTELVRRGLIRREGRALVVPAMERLADEMRHLAPGA